MTTLPLAGAAPVPASTPSSGDVIVSTTRAR